MQNSNSSQNVGMQEKHMCKLSRLLSIFLFFLFAGCARLPDYAVPQLIEIENYEDALNQGITYRTLGVEDFRAKTTHRDMGGHANHLSAEIVTKVRLAESSTFRFDTKRHQDQIMYYCKVENIAFEAVMLPDYSWWSQKVSPFQKPYILQHEQIHFAITELTARQLSKKARREMKNFVAVGVTKKRAKEHLKEKITPLLQEALNSNMQRQLEFDQETSLHFDPVKQQKWFEEINTLLQETDLGT
jgi:uncharacterized protein DUF922